MRYLSLLIFLVSVSLCDTLSISKDFTSVSSGAYQIIVEDKNKEISVSEILNDRHEANYFKDRTSPTHSVFWTKVTLKNSSEKKQHLVFENSRAGTDKIDVYVYKDKELVYSQMLGDVREQKLRDHLSPKSAFFLEFAANEEYVIISRLESMGPMNLSWKIISKDLFLKDSSLSFLFNGLFAGVLIALVIYNLLLFKSLKDISFLLYVFLASSMLWIQYTFSGMFYFLDIGMNLSFLSISAWFVPYMYSALFVLFAISFFKIHEKSRTFFYLFLGMSAFGFILTLLSFLLFMDSTLAIYTSYSYTYLYLSMLIVFAYAIYATFKGFPFAVYFLLGEGAYIGTFVYSILVISGAINMPKGLQFLVPTAMMLEVIIFSIALSKRVKLLKRNSDAQEVLLVEESKFSAIGKSIGNVAHQWKTPLSQLNTHLLYLRGLYHVGNQKTLLEEFGTSVEKMGQIMNYMKSSIDELHDFYSDVDTNTAFKIKKQIALAMTLQNDKLILNNVEVNVECDEELYLLGAKHGFANILMILFDNSIYQFEKTKKTGGKIDIFVLKTERHIKIHFKDNAGGIKIEPIEKVFEMQFTTKGSEGCGLGLPLAKKLAKNALYGDIEVKNSAEGVEFVITV